MQTVVDPLVECNQGLEEDIEQILRAPLTPKKIYDAWNRVAYDKHTTKCSYLSDALTRKLKKLISIFSLEQWKEVFNEIIGNEFFHGSGWFCLSWIAMPENFTKVLDGVYHQTNRKQFLPQNTVGDQKSVQTMLDKWRKQRRQENA